MALQMIALKCPSCNADLKIEADRKKAFCTYCGAEILIDNTNEHIYRTIDEAKIKHEEAKMKSTEAEYQFKLKQLELKENAKKQKKLIIAIIIILLLLMIFFDSVFKIAGGYLSMIGIALLMLLVMYLDSNKKN